MNRHHLLGAPWAGYRRGWLRADVVAGVTVTAYLVPQVMAYAELAGLPAATGLWAAVGSLGCYAVAGSSRQLSVGPESTTALMTAAALTTAAAGTDRAAVAAALALAVALVCLVGVLVGMDRFADLLSRPVLVGYMVGIALVMVVSQLGTLTGVDARGDTTLAELRAFLAGIGSAHPPTLALGLVTTAVLLGGAALRPRAPLALLGIVAATAAVTLLDLDRTGIRRVADLRATAPTIGLPDVPLDEVGHLLIPAIGIAIVGFTDNVLTARAFADPRAETISPRRELVAMGLANAGAGLFHGFPVSSSASRTAIAATAGARSQMASVAALVATVVAALSLSPLLGLVPTAALGAVVVYAATRLVDVAELRRIARFRRSELVIAVATTTAVVVTGVLVGVLIAIGLSVLDLMRRVARPNDSVLGSVPGLDGLHDVEDYPEAVQVPGLVIYRYDSPLFFANAEDFRVRALAAADAAPDLRWFVLTTEAIVEVDLTGVDALEAVRAELHERGVVMALARVKRELRAMLEPAGILDRIGEEHVFPTLATAIAAYRMENGGRDESPVGNG